MIAWPNYEPEAEVPSFGDFARTVLIPDGPFKGDLYEPASEAPQQIICDVMDGKIVGPGGKPYKSLVIAWCTQSGKSLVSVLVPALHSVVGKRESVVYCLPTRDLIGKVWTDKLKPAIEESGFADWVPQTGPGSRGGMPSSLPFVDPVTKRRAGSVIFVAGGSGNRREVGQAGVTASMVVLDEADEYESMHRVALIEQRAAAFGADAVFIKASTVKKDDNSIILEAVRDSNDSRVWYQCPLCGRYQPMEWEQVTYTGVDDISVAESARYMCVHCEQPLDERDRLVMLSQYRLVMKGQTVTKAGKVTGDIPRSLVFGLLCWKLDFAIGYGLPNLAMEHRRAKKMITDRNEHGAMRSFYRDRLSREYRDDRSEIPSVLTNKFLAQKSAAANWSKRSVPAWAEYLYLAVDVQHDRVYWLVIAVTQGMQWAPVDWGYEYGDCQRGQKATKEQRHGQLNWVRNRSDAGWGMVGCDDDEVMVPVYNCVDVGYQTDEVTFWIKMQVGDKWIAVRGYGEHEDEKGVKAGKREHDLQGWGELRYLSDRREYWLYCHSKNVVKAMHDSLLRPSGYAGSGEIPLDSSGEPMKMNNALLLHITKNVYDFDVTKEKWYWRKVHAGRLDWRDCIKYAKTLARFHIDDMQKKRKKRAPRKRTGMRKVGSIGG